MKSTEAGILVTLLLGTFCLAMLSPPELAIMSGITMGLFVLALLEITEALNHTVRLTWVMLGTVVGFAVLGLIFSVSMSR
jgi:hypothetical protein